MKLTESMLRKIIREEIESVGMLPSAGEEAAAPKTETIKIDDPSITVNAFNIRYKKMQDSISVDGNPIGTEDKTKARQDSISGKNVTLPLKQLEDGFLVATLPIHKDYGMMRGTTGTIYKFRKLNDKKEFSKEEQNKAEELVGVGPGDFNPLRSRFDKGYIYRESGVDKHGAFYMLTQIHDI